MDWLKIAGVSLTITGLISGFLWHLFNLRGKDLRNVYTRIDNLTELVNQLTIRQTILETKLNNGISEEIKKLRTTRHDHGNALQALRSEIEHVKDMLK